MSIGVNIIGGDITEPFVIAPVVIVIDECPDVAKLASKKCSSQKRPVSGNKCTHRRLDVSYHVTYHSSTNIARGKTYLVAMVAEY